MLPGDKILTNCFVTNVPWQVWSNCTIKKAFNRANNMALKVILLAIIDRDVWFYVKN